MSKSYNNAVLMSDSKDQVKAKIKTMYTDPKKIHLGDPGDPDGCVVYATHQLFTPAPETEDIGRRCRTGGLGCAACTTRLAEAVIAGLEPLRERRAHWVKRTEDFRMIVNEGSKKAAQVAAETMTKVREALHFAQPVSS